MRVLVCGSRHFDDWDLMNSELIKVWRSLPYLEESGNKKDLLIIEGGAKGADFLSRVWAKFSNVDFIEFPADWNKHGKAAGHIRNKQMLDEGKPYLVIAFLAKDSRGTANMIQQAEASGIPVKTISIDYTMPLGAP